MHTKPLLTALCFALMTLPAQGKKADTITLESVPAAKTRCARDEKRRQP